MMSNQLFSSTEELYYEASADEALNSYHQQSQMRYYENVVYIPQVFMPVMLVEHVPVFYNYLTYEPYLMNRFEVVYAPFLRQAYVPYLVPYYLQTPEFFSSSTENEYDTPSNSYPESNISDESSSDDLSSSVSYSDETSVLTLSSSYSYNSYKDSDFSSTPEPCESLGGIACNENDDSFDLNCVEELNIAWGYTEGFSSSIAVDVGIGANASNSSLLLLDKENSLAALNCSGKLLDQISSPENRNVVSNVSSISLLVNDEKPKDLRDLETDEASPLEGIEKAEYESHLSPGTFENHVVLDDNMDLKPHVSNLPLLVDDETPEDLRGSETYEASSLKDKEKDEYERDFLPERFENCVIFDDSITLKCRASDLPLHDYVKKSEGENKLQQNELSLLKNEYVKQYDSHTSSQMVAWSQGTSLQEPDSLDETDVKVPHSFDYDSSETESDSDGDPAITLQDILASDENCRVKRKEYVERQRNSVLYRSALEGDIRPRRSIPEVGTLATIFEDLPYPINDPYDDGVELDQESVKDDYFDLPPLDVEQSKSSSTTLLPRKKRFRNTRKFFSGLFRCFKPR